MAIIIRKMEYAIESFLKNGDWEYIKWVDSQAQKGYYSNYEKVD